MVVEDRASHYCGDIVRWNVEAVTLRERGGHLRHFGWKPGGFLIDGKPVTLVRPATSATATQRVTASGSVAGDGRRPGRPGEPDLGGGHPRRRADRARVGRRPARARPRRRTAPRRGRPRRRGRRVRTEPRPPDRRAARPPRAGLEGDPDRADRPRPERVDHRPPVRRCLGRHPAEGVGPGRVARRARTEAMDALCSGRKACAPRSACRSRASGRGCEIRSTRSPTFAPNSSVPSSSSSTSSGNERQRLRPSGRPVARRGQQVISSRVEVARSGARAYDLAAAGRGPP